MWEKFKEILPGVLVSLVITLISTSLVFWGNYSSLSANVLRNTDELRQTVKKDEFKAILDGQKDMTQQIDKRMDRIENKVDRINDRLK